MPWTKLLADAYFGKYEKKKGRRVLTYQESIREALIQAMKIDSRVFIMGEGVDDQGGIFGSTKDLHKIFGEERVFDLPLCENSFTGFAIGAALAGMRPVLVHMRMDFMLLSMDQIVNHASKWRYMFGGAQSVPVVIRSIIGRGWGSGAQHSQSLEGLFMHIPGLKIVCPSSSYDVKGLLLASIADNDPVIFIEHRWLYKTKGYVPYRPYIVPLGKANIVRKGSDVTVVAYSLMVKEALIAAEELSQKGINIEIVDLRTLVPFDIETVLNSVRKTKRVVVASLDWERAGVSAAISTLIYEEAWRFLCAPIKRVCLPNVATPSSHILENEFYKGKDDIINAVRDICDS